MDPTASQIKLRPGIGAHAAMTSTSSYDEIFCNDAFGRSQLEQLLQA
jgi:hypothetical protein